MTNPTHLLQLVDRAEFRTLFVEELGWNNPDQPDTTLQVEGVSFTLHNVASYKGLRIWLCDVLPPRQSQRIIDDLIGQTSHERLVIFADTEHQEWRWPRRAQLSGANAKLLVHAHTIGAEDDHLLNQLETIAIDLEDNITLLELLTRMRAAFDAEAEAASVQAARLMKTLYAQLDAAGVPEIDSTLLLARLLFLLFGDDGGMWRADMFDSYLGNHTTDRDLHLQLPELFDVLDLPTSKRSLAEGSPLAEFAYINGGLYKQRLTLPPLPAEFRATLLEACQFDWAKISPAVFGSMFQTVKDRDARRRGGEHYTTEANILKTIGPLFLDEYRERLDAAWNDRKGLNKLHTDLGAMRFLDPACGCGNFLIVTYRELRALELELLKRQQDLDILEGLHTPASRGQQSFDVTGDIRVTLDHFYGIEIEEWPARIAETAMLLVDHLANERMAQDFGFAPDRLPISIAPTIVHGDALEVDWSDVLEPTASTYVLGNPPFIGISLRSAAQTEQLKAVWGKSYHGTLDYVSGWHRKAVTYLGNTGGRFALVSTNSICQGEQVAPLWGTLLAEGFEIDFAHQTFAWTTEATGGAVVHVIIVGASKATSKRPKTIYEYDTAFSAPRRREVTNITPYLVEGPSIVVAPRSHPLAPDLPPVTYGNKPSDGGHLVVDQNDIDTARADAIAAQYLRPYVGAREVIHNTPRWCLWLPGVSAAEVSAIPFLRDRVDAVEVFRANSDAPSTREYGQPTLFRQISQPATDYLAIARHVSESRPYFPAGYYTPDVIASDATFIAADPTGMGLAVISSSMFLAWLKAVGGRIKSDLRFSKLGVWNTFPLRRMTDTERASLIEAGQAIVAVRALHASSSLAHLYDSVVMPDDLRDAHMRLDERVDALFGIDSDVTEEQRQSVLFDRYAQMLHANELPTPSTRRRRRA